MKHFHFVKYQTFSLGSYHFADESCAWYAFAKCDYFPQVNPMSSLRELHIKSLKVRSLTMANFLLDSFPSLEKTSSWMLNMNQEDTRAFRARVKEYRERGIKIEYKEW